MFRTFSLAAVLAAFALAVLGSWVRINGAGLTCPDWPLCNGQLIPPLDGAVILEWSHRMVALLEGVLVLGAALAAWQSRARIAFVRPVLAFIGVVFAIQVGLGGATVLLANNPPSVVWHWAAAMLFLSGLVALAILAFAQPPAGSRLPPQGALYPLLGVTVLAAFATMCIGAFVSSSGAGLACLSFPACEGGIFGATGPQMAQMLHRLAAGVFFVCATGVAYAAAITAAGRLRVAVLGGYALVVLQVFLGIANVVWALPIALREAHAANAAATFLAFVAAFVLASLDGTVSEAASVRPLGAAMTSRS
jgi:heme A synthase